MRFEVRGIKAPQGITAFAVDAADELDARSQAEARGYVIVAVRSASEWRLRRERFPLLLFSQQLIALLDAGLGLVEALQALAEKHQQNDASGVMKRVLDHLYQGHPLSYALERCPEAFPRLYIATVRASEHTGDLGPALSRYIAYQLQIDTLRSKLVTASIYPLLLIGVGSTVTLFLLAYVVPKFSAIYEDIGRDQPMGSRLLMGFGAFLNHNAVWMLVLAAAVVAMAMHAFFDPRLRQHLWGWIADLPGLAEKIRVVQIGRLYRTTGMLLRGGIPAVQALEMVGELLPLRLRDQLQLALRDIREGKPLSGAMESHELTTPVGLRMLRVGERTGDMGSMMERAASFHDAEIVEWVDRTTRLFEPLLMAFIGLVIGVIVMALYMPIFDLAGSLQ